MADTGPARLLPRKVPRPRIFSCEGEDIKLDKVKIWVRTVKKYLVRSVLNPDSIGVADHYGFYREGKANNTFQTLDRERKTSLYDN